MILAAQIHSGAHKKVEQLHKVLQELDSFSIMRDVWKREILYAFFVADGEDSQRGSLWCEAAHTTADDVKAEMGRLLGLLKPAEIDREQEDRAVTPVISSDSEEMGTDHAVMLIHGIRTQAEWQQRVATAIEDNSKIKVIPTRYEFLDVVRFLVPLRGFRSQPVDRIAKLIRDESKRTARISVIAHSFGSFIVSELLRKYSDIEFHRVILCGSIVKDDFPWDMYSRRIAPNENLEWQVLNDCGMQDIWPVMAKSMTWGYGSSGRFGFGHNRVKDRFHTKGHGDFFTAKFAIEYWLPYLNNGKIKSSTIDRVPNSWWVSILTVFRIKYLILIAILCFIGIVFFELNEVVIAKAAEQ
jgi:pimeloyl-ACP methyl ester carboxylesterase